MRQHISKLVISTFGLVALFGLTLAVALNSNESRQEISNEIQKEQVVQNVDTSQLPTSDIADIAQTELVETPVSIDEDTQLIDGYSIIASSDPVGTRHAGYFVLIDENIHYYRPDNAILNQPENFKFENADKETLEMVGGYVAHDNEQFHFVAYDKDGWGSFSYPLSDSILEFLSTPHLAGVEAGSELYAFISWKNKDALTSKSIVVEESESLAPLSLAFRQWNFYEVKNSNDEIISHVGIYGSQNTKIMSTGNSLLIFTSEGIYESEKETMELSEIVNVPSYQVAFESWFDQIYINHSFNGNLHIHKYDLENKTRESVYTFPEEFDVKRSTRIVPTPKENILLTSVVYGDNLHTILINLADDTFETVSSAEERKGGNLFPAFVSPDLNRVFAISIPYEGYLFAPLKVFNRNLETNLWEMSPIIVEGTGVEVGGGWNVDTGQWQLSPDRTKLAYTDATDDSIDSCFGFGDVPRAHNLLRTLDLNTLEIKTIEDGSPTSEYTLEKWINNDEILYSLDNAIVDESGCWNGSERIEASVRRNINH